MAQNFDDEEYSLDEKHPQFALIKKHIERAVQDLFLDSLRNETDNLVHIFSNEAQIDGFIGRILNYWETFEEYETCKEVISLSKKFKKRWKNRENIPHSDGLVRLKSLFDANE